MKTGNIVFFCENEIEREVVLEVLKGNKKIDSKSIEDEESCDFVTLYQCIEPLDLQKIKLEIEKKMEAKRIELVRQEAYEALYKVQEVLDTLEVNTYSRDCFYEAIYRLQEGIENIC